jgi:hypothetical protein
MDTLTTTTTSTTGATATMPAGGMTESVVDAFLDMLEQYFEALEEVFPECLKVKQYKIGLSVRLARCEDSAEHRVVGREAIMSYHESMGPYYQRCLSKDESLLQEDIEIMNNLGMQEKWTGDLHPQTKDAIWEYITKLNEFSNIYSMYANVPCGMMNSIETMATSIAGRIGNGDMSLSDLNLQEMSAEVMHAIDPNELQEFAQTLQNGNVMENVTSMYSMMSSMMQGAQM